MSDPSADSPPPPPPPNTDSDSPTPLFPPQRTHVRVATTGNIHLSVKSQKGEFLYEVSSHILSESSPVFRRMFATDSPFLEGQLLSDAQTTGVKPAFSLPEDDPDALLIILRILHLKHSSLPANVGFETMVELAILADKYELVEALQFWVAKWTTLFGCPMETVGEENWLVVCSIFQLSQLGDLVKVVAWRSYGSDKGDGELIFKKPGVLAEPTEYSLHPCLKEETLKSLKSIRKTILDTLRAALENTYTKYSNCLRLGGAVCKKAPTMLMECENCDVLQYGDMQLQVLQHNLRDDAFWRGQPNVIIKVLETLKKRQFPMLYAPQKPPPVSENPPSAGLKALLKHCQDEQQRYFLKNQHHSDCYWSVGIIKAVIKIKGDTRTTKASTSLFGKPMVTAKSPSVFGAGGTARTTPFGGSTGSSNITFGNVN